MPLVEHLYELRSRLGKALLGVTLGIIVAFIFREQVFDFLKEPYCRVDLGERSGTPQDCQLVSLSPLDQFQVFLKLSFIAGIVFSAPIWLYQIGAFITPALHKHEKRYAAGFLFFSLLMFTTGMVFAYFTMTRALEFLLNFGGDGVVALTSIQSYLSFVTLLMICFGIAFEFPVVILFLHLTGVLSSARMRSWRRGMIVGVAILSAVITPTTDPYTFAFMAVPLLVLYEGCILFARIRERVKRKELAADPVFGIDDDAASPSPEGPRSLDHE